MKYITYTLPNDPSTTIFETETCIAVKVTQSELCSSIEILPIMNGKICMYPIRQWFYAYESKDAILTQVIDIITNASIELTPPKIKLFDNITKICISKFPKEEDLYIQIYSYTKKESGIIVLSKSVSWENSEANMLIVAPSLFDADQYIVYDDIDEPLPISMLKQHYVSCDK